MIPLCILLRFNLGLRRGMPMWGVGMLGNLIMKIAYLCGL